MTVSHDGIRVAASGFVPDCGAKVPLRKEDGPRSPVERGGRP